MKKIYSSLAILAKLFILLFCAIPTFVLAQNTSSSQNDFILKQVNQGNGNSALSETSIDLQHPTDDDELDLVQLKSLIFDNIPTIYIVNRNVQDSEESFPQRLISDVSSLGVLSDDGNKTRTIKLLQVNINQIQEKNLVRLNQSNLEGFKNLTHIFIKSTVSLSKEEVSQMISGFENGDVVLLYQVNSNF